jgi:hypothetical protein
MASMAAAQRRGAARAAAKRRRQTIFLVVLVALLAVLLAWELPHVLKRSGGADSSAAPVVAATSLSHGAKSLPRRAHGDPFQGNPLPNQDPAPVTRGGRDPFKGGGSVQRTQGPIPGQYVIQKHQIVIGRPGPHRVATHGWIVILASIPTRNGRANAAQFARRARPNVGSLSILNSSNRRPLRGGYWVVYSGPDQTMAAVSRRASRIHAAGYGTAYMRELITYR